MRFQKGNKYGAKSKGVRKNSKRTIWLLESLAEHGYDYEAMLSKFLKAGDVKMAELLIRMVPHIANAPKQDITLDGVETLVINRYKEQDTDNKE